MGDIKSFSKELLQLIGKGKINSREELASLKGVISKKHGLKEIPSNPTILSFSTKRTPKQFEILSLKPTRSLSGLAVVAVMVPPHDCPGKCIYCPSSLLEGKDVPKSYTGNEPAAMRGVLADFNPKIQIAGRLRQLDEIGHSIAKIELVVMGGTFLSMPYSFQKKFMLSCINTISGTRARSIEKAKQLAMTADRRITGITFETRPDYCGSKEIDSMLSFGGTRCELGVQTISDKIYKKIRGRNAKKYRGFVEN